jgi:hypothetical protein
MWVGDTVYKQPEKVPLFFQRLREMGITTAMVHGDGDTRPLLENRFPYYVENLVNRGLCLKFNSKVTDWDKFVTEWARNGRQQTALVRDYCLDDPQWRDWAANQVRRLVAKNMTNQPLAYNLRDELSTTLSANPFDYDFNPIALAKFREWLRTQYPTLAALNQQWETKFDAWEAVRPFTTDEIKNRMSTGDARPRGNPDWQALQQLKLDPPAARNSPTRWNFSPWADFRTYMDLSLARALNDLRAAARELDPRTPVGIEGTQMPHAFGGYDLLRLAGALDWVEPYDIGNAREIFGSFMPGKPIVTTVFEKETNPARRRLWHLLLEGDRGCIIWWSEDCIDWASPDYALTPKAKALAPVLAEMKSPLAQLFLRAERERDPVFIHYSQPSIQVNWLLESTIDGSTWLRRFSSFEAEHNRMAKVRNGWLKVFQDLGFSPRFVSPETLESGLKSAKGPAVVVLPGSWAVSDHEASGLRAFLEAGAKDNSRGVFYDAAPGVFDEHGKLRGKGALEDLGVPANSPLPASAVLTAVGSATTNSQDVAKYPSQRLQARAETAFATWIRSKFPVEPPVRVPIEARVRVHRFKTEGARLIAFERNIDYHMSEDLKQAGGNENLERPIEVEASLKVPGYVLDLRSGKNLGLLTSFRFLLDPWQPALYGVTDTKQAGDRLLASIPRS